MKINVLFDEITLKNRIHELGTQISDDYRNKKLLLICILKGGVVFMTDLMREITIPLETEFLRASSYKGQCSGKLEIQENSINKLDISDYHVIIVEDILDTGNTLFNISALLRAENPKSLKLCVLLDKPSRRESPISADYSGFEIPDRFVVGFGLDYDEKYRNLPYIGEMLPEENT